MAEEEKKEKEVVQEDELTKCQKDRDEYLAGWQRARADLINYKKDEAERISRTIQFANEDLISDLLVVLDSFALVENSLVSRDSDLKPFLLIKSQLENVLKHRGLEKLKVKKGDNFDPIFHEAVEAVKDEAFETNQIIEVVADGYNLNGKLIRPARVRVSK